jgi:proteasome lid subunit RPN8/RPN11
MGFYHSHPDAPVQPSQTDLENAWPFYTYLIVSLQDGEPRDVAVWLLRQDKVAFELDELQLF